MEFPKSLETIPVVVGESLKNQMVEWEQKGIFYGVFPVVGDSMTCDDSTKSIPHNSKVLAYELQINCNNITSKFLHIPMNVPLIISGQTSYGKNFCLCKTINFIDLVNNKVSLRSYNSNYHDQVIPINYIAHLLKIELVIK